MKARIVEEVRSCVFRVITGKTWLMEVTEAQRPYIAEQIGKELILLVDKKKDHLKLIMFQNVVKSPVIGKTKTKSKQEIWAAEREAFEARQNLNSHTGHHRSGDIDWEQAALHARRVKKESNAIKARIRRANEH